MITAAGFLLLAILGALPYHILFQFRGVPAFVLGITVLGLFLFFWNRVTQPMSARVNIILDIVLLSLIYIVPRVLIIHYFPVHIQIDFSQYHEYASQLAKGITFPIREYDQWFLYLPFKAGYAAFLSLIYQWFGTDPAWGRIINLIAGYLSMGLVYRITLEGFSRPAARGAALMMAMLPSYLLYVPHLGTEPLFTLFFLTTVYLIWKSIHHPKGYLYFAAGLTAATATVFRPTIPPLLAAMSVWLILYLPRTVWKKTLLYLGILLVTFISGVGFWTYSIENRTTLNIQETSPWLSLMIGSTVSSGGRPLPYHYHSLDPILKDREACDRFCIQEIKKNLNDIKSVWASFLWQKYRNTWSGDDYSLIFTHDYLIQSKAPRVWNWFDRNFYAIWHIQAMAFTLLLILTLAGFWYYRNGHPLITLVSFVFLAYMVFHMIMEAQYRYHYQVVPLLMIPAGAAIARLLKSDTTRTQ